MLCVFQVNKGEFLAISDEVQPTSRVCELSAVLAKQHRISEDKQVLLTHEGRLLDAQEMIGAYGAGTETLPILLYDMSLIKGEIHPQPSVVVELGESYSQALEAMKQSNGDMKQQIALAKKLATSCDVLSEKCIKVVNEQELQLQGWSAAVANSNTVLGNFIQQVKMLKESAGSFTKSKAAYQKLVDSFPQVLDQLKQLKIPKQLLGERSSRSHATTLLEWIGTHDQSSTLTDLAKECKNALESQGEERTQRMISDAESAIASIPDQNKALEEWKSKMLLDDRSACLKRVRTLAEEAKDFVKKLVATSERALKSGERSVVRELTLSNWKTLSMMSKQHSEIQSVVKECISYKEQLTVEINQQLKLVSEVQTKVNDSERHIPLLKERMRRIAHRFTILGQISEAPKTLVCAVAEVIRRRRFHQQFIKLLEGSFESFSTIRTTEIKARKQFSSENGKHFLMQLFQQPLNDRPPELTQPLHRQFDQKLPDISEEDVSEMLNVVSTDLQQQLKNAMDFTVEGIAVSTQQGEIDSSMYASASDNDSLLKEIAKLEVENRQYQEEIEHLKERSQQMVSSYKALEENLREEKMVEVRRLEMQVEYLTDQQSRSQRLATEEKVTISEGLEEKNREISFLKTNLDVLQRELDQYKLMVKEKENLLQEIGDELKSKETKVSDLLEIQKALVQEKDALLDSQEKNIAELTHKLKLRTESIDNEKSERCKAENDKKILEENLKESRAELHRAIADCEKIRSECLSTKLQLEKYEKEKEFMSESFDQLKSVHQEKSAELSRVESELSQQVVKLESRVSSLSDDNTKLTIKNGSLNNKVSQLAAEIEEKTNKIAELESTLADITRRLNDKDEQYSLMETNLKSQLAAKEKVVIELKELRETLERNLQTEMSKLESCEQKNSSLASLLKEYKLNATLAEAQLKEKTAQYQTDISIMKDNHIKKVDALSLQVKQCELAAETQLKEKVISHENIISLLKENYDKEVDELKLQLREAKEKAISIDEMRKKVTRYESDISLLKEVSGKTDMLTSQLRECREKTETQAKTIAQYESDILLLKENNSRDMKVVIAEKQKEIDELTGRKASLENDLLEWQKKCMEAERDLKDCQHLVEKAPGKSMWSSATYGKDMTESNAIVPTLLAATPLKLEASQSVSIKIHSLQVDDYALFMPDKYNNYLAITVDGKHYYLDKKSASTFTSPHDSPNKAVKFLLGKISNRVHCEVKKDGNRLRVPVGSKVYRLTADEWKPS